MITEMSPSTEPENDMQKWMRSKWAAYCDRIMDIRISALVMWKKGEITEKERDEIWDGILVPLKDREQMIAIINDENS